MASEASSEPNDEHWGYVSGLCDADFAISEREWDAFTGLCAVYQDSGYDMALDDDQALASEAAGLADDIAEDRRAREEAGLVAVAEMYITWTRIGLRYQRTGEAEPGGPDGAPLVQDDVQ